MCNKIVNNIDSIAFVLQHRVALLYCCTSVRPYVPVYLYCTGTVRVLYGLSTAVKQ